LLRHFFVEFPLENGFFYSLNGVAIAWRPGDVEAATVTPSFEGLTGRPVNDLDLGEGGGNGAGNAAGNEQKRGKQRFHDDLLG
jgi:hypothetical protein